jgi:DNA helicase-2/ATP-dependent DNA helicase PcrA
MPATPVAPKVIEHVPSADFIQQAILRFTGRTKSRTSKVWLWRSFKMEGSAHNPIATVKFEHNGEKKIMLNYAKLRMNKLKSNCLQSILGKLSRCGMVIVVLFFLI